MEKEEIQKLVAGSISAAMEPITQMVGTLSDTMVRMAEQQTAMQKQLPNSEDPDEGVSQGVKDFIKNERENPLGGKPLEGTSPNQQRATNSNNNQLSGKEI